MSKSNYKFLKVYTFVIVHFIMVINMFSVFSKDPVLVNTIPTILLSLVFSFMVTVDGNLISFWGLLSGIIYVKNFYYYFIVYKYVISGKIYTSALPYIEPTLESYKTAGLLLLAETLTILVVYIFRKKRLNGITIVDCKKNFYGSKVIIALLILVKIIFKLLLSYGILNLTTANYIDFVLTIVLYFEIISYIIITYGERDRSFTLSVVITIIAILAIISISRKQAVFFIVSSFLLIRQLYPSYKKKVNFFLIVITLFVLYFLTMTRFGDSAIMDMFTKPYRLESYFLPIRKTATGVELFRFGHPNIKPSFVFDIVRPMILIGPVISNLSNPLSVDLFNIRLSYGGLYRFDQIYPFIAQLYNYSYILIIPVITLLLVVANKIQLNLKESNYRDANDVFFMTYLLLVLSQFPITNLTIIINMISYQIAPIYFLVKTRRYIEKRK